MEHNLKWKFFWCTGFRFGGINLHVAKELFSIDLATVVQQHGNLSEDGTKEGKDFFEHEMNSAALKHFTFQINLPNLRCAVAHCLRWLQTICSTILHGVHSTRVPGREKKNF